MEDEPNQSEATVCHGRLTMSQSITPTWEHSPLSLTVNMSVMLITEINVLSSQKTLEIRKNQVDQFV